MIPREINQTVQKIVKTWTNKMDVIFFSSPTKKRSHFCSAALLFGLWNHWAPQILKDGFVHEGYHLVKKKKWNKIKWSFTVKPALKITSNIYRCCSWSDWKKKMFWKILCLRPNQLSGNYSETKKKKKEYWKIHTHI